MAAMKMIQTTMPRILSAFDVGSKEYSTLLEVMQKLSKTFGSEQDGGLVPSAVLQLMQQSKRPGGAPPPAPPPGLAPGAAAPGMLGG